LAKKEMICPFLGQPCKNCAIYIGRHYYLCYCANYRGYLGGKRRTKKGSGHRTFGAKKKKDVRLPIVDIKALDPFDTAL
jgi:hypothetical protein